MHAQKENINKLRHLLMMEREAFSAFLDKVRLAKEQKKDIQANEIVAQIKEQRSQELLNYNNQQYVQQAAQNNSTSIRSTEFELNLPKRVTTDISLDHQPIAIQKHVVNNAKISVDEVVKSMKERLPESRFNQLHEENIHHAFGYDLNKSEEEQFNDQVRLFEDIHQQAEEMLAAGALDKEVERNDQKHFGCDIVDELHSNAYHAAQKSVNNHEHVAEFYRHMTAKHLVERLFCHAASHAAHEDYRNEVRNVSTFVKNEAPRFVNSLGLLQEQLMSQGKTYYPMNDWSRYGEVPNLNNIRPKPTPSSNTNKKKEEEQQWRVLPQSNSA